MATPTKKKAEEKYVKDDKKKPGDGTETDAGSAAGDGTENGAGSAEGDGTENGAGSAAGAGSENGVGSAAGDGTENGAGSAAGDGPENGAGSAAGDGSENGAGSAAGDGTENDAGSAAGDGSENDSGSAAGDALITVDTANTGLSGLINTVGGQKIALDLIRSSVKKPYASTDTKPNWFTVQVVRSPSGRRFRAGVEFTSEPKPYDFSLFSDEQREALAADPFLRIKPFTPAEE
ncbi:hypothetical protein [Serratia nevei]|uniref:hypothetical protein n=1 Tax=Serratia nevei TaxID=2703794 RepID=UPI00313EFEFD